MFTAPILPLSLSPHICVLPSPDLVELLASSSLPPLQHLLQSFSPLTQGTRVQPPSRPLQNVASPPVTTRTTALTTVSHASFPLRFSDLNDIEAACKEDEDERAGRTIDWIGQRIARRAAGWVEHVEREGDMETRDAKTPWWAELQRCTEGDRTPSQFEGWNHPVAGPWAWRVHIHFQWLILQADSCLGCFNACAKSITSRHRLAVQANRPSNLVRPRNAPSYSHHTPFEFSPELR